MLNNIISKYSRWKNRRETFNSLHRLTDSELRDIGICRGDIRSIANDTWNENLRGWN
jgi:uncharacterized protein YjiS (DUF1127 family)